MKKENRCKTAITKGIIRLDNHCFDENVCIWCNIYVSDEMLDLLMSQGKDNRYIKKFHE